MTKNQRMGAVAAMILKWKLKLGLSEWIINVHFSSKCHKDDGECEADISDDLKYLEADLTIYPKFWENDREHQEINIIHELVHLLICPLHPFLGNAADDVLEGVVQKIAVNFKKQ